MQGKAVIKKVAFVRSSQASMTEVFHKFLVAMRVRASPVSMVILLGTYMLSRHGPRYIQPQ